MSKQITIRAIAARTGAGKSTVSLALRRSPLLLPETGERIRAAAEEMGWRPNPAVSAWMAHRRSSRPDRAGQQIVFLNVFRDQRFWRKRPSFTRFVLGVEHRAKALGYGFEEILAAAPKMTSSRLDRILRARGIEGVVVGPATTSHAHLSLAWERFAAVTHGFSLINPPLSRTAADCTFAMLQTLRELRRLGYRRIGLLLQPEHDVRGRYFWSSAFHTYQRQIASQDRLSIFGGKDSDTKALSRWLKQQRPEVVITCNVDFRREIQKLGYRVPDDIGFASLDVHRGYENINEGFEDCAGFDLHIEQTGGAAVDLLVSQLHANERGIPTFPRTLLTQGEWVPGSTVRRIGPVVPLCSLTKSTSLLTE
jgi:DNA-binding LacI/PurR family transcriptional regulator